MPSAVILQELQTGSVTLCPVGKRVAVGRNAQSFVVCKDKHVSRHHCEAEALPDGRLRLVDRSSYGTYLNDERIEEAVARPGDRIVLGHDYALKVVGLLDPDASHHGEKEPVPPRYLGAHYLLLREVGRGGMGIVYEAWDEQRKQRCAVKWLRGGGEADPDAIARFRREVLVQGKLADYPAIVSVYDLGIVTGSGEWFCVMEYVVGETLLARLRSGSLSREEGVRLIARVARAVGYAHRRGVVHRDIKPANILITPEGQVRLTDFGIAKALDESGRLTLPGIMMGTPGYMAPEQITDSKRAGPAADIYALGALLFTILCGKLPVRGRNLREAIDNARKGKLGPSAQELDPTVPEALDAACRQALSFRPEDRWPTAEDFAAALENFLREETPSERVRLQAPPR
ncbi:MAG: FHA domain-containing protein [Planctomycetota bacterium]|nr:MAG: FHA domain-containing protein [Planctomycetota bacterium]